MGKLLQLGADPSKLYEQFRQKEQERSVVQLKVMAEAVQEGTGCGG